MKTTKYKIINIFSTLLIAIASIVLFSCRDDFDFNDPEIGEGSRDIEFKMQFNPMTGVDLNTRALTPGNLIETINSLTICAYDRNGKLYRIYRPGDSDVEYLAPTDIKTTMNDSEGNPIEKTVKQLNFKIKDIPYGRYQFFAVSNCNKVTETTASTVEDLQKISVSWNSENIGENNAMYGYFDYESEKEGSFDRPFSFGGQVVVVNKDKGVFHAWLRRLASKVTLGFDPTGLKPNVIIYIKSVTIKDIPLTCKLGEDNSPSKDTELQTNGQTIYYGPEGPQDKPGARYTDWLAIGRGSGVMDQWHEDDSPSLYFFENMQGNYSSHPNKQKYDKRMDKTAIGTNIKNPGQPDYKDEVVYGTYIEVEAYYNSINQENTTSGPIVYRFMLGKDTEYDYNAQRNHHYKVTLGFKGWANQPDWHINYEEEDPAILAADEFRVSYIYNSLSTMPVKVNGNCIKFEARIIQNNWYPCDTTQRKDSLPAQSIGDFKWYKEMATKYNGRDYPYLGFLALKVKEEADGSVATNIINDQGFATETKAQNALKTYYESNGQNYREYNVNPGTYGGAFDPNKTHYNSYEVKNINGTDPAKHQACPANASASREFLIPLITRNKSMIEGSGFSGNNPYESFERKAIVRLTAYFDVGNGRTVKREKDVIVYQVRRLVNPKAIWKTSANDDNFRVELCYAKSPLDATYTDVKSQGEWKAYVRTSNVADPSTFIKLKDVNGKTYMSGDTICGSTLSTIQFLVEFVGANPDDTPRCAVINVLYHGNQCEHKILVRQGFKEPLQVVAGKAPWSSFCLFSCNDANATLGATGKIFTAEATVNPLAMGTLFKCRNYQQGILISNNDTYGPLEIIKGGKFDLSNNSSDTWTNIKYAPRTTVVNDGWTRPGGTAIPWSKFKVTRNNKEYIYRVASYDDFKSLDDADFAFGIAYSDGATRTEKNIEASYSFTDINNNNNNDKGSTKGVRCVLAYRKSDANQVIFPLGAFGMARRTQFNIQFDNASNYYGMLRYSDVSKVLDGERDQYRPIPYNLPRSPGAVYWINEWQTNGHYEGSTYYPCYGWDINYFNFDFNSYTQNNRRDACPIKLVCESVKDLKTGKTTTYVRDNRKKR